MCLVAALEGGIDVLQTELLTRIDDHLFAIVHGSHLLSGFDSAFFKRGPSRREQTTKTPGILRSDCELRQDNGTFRPPLMLFTSNLNVTILLHLCPVPFSR